MSLVFVRPGSFQMGSPTTEEGRDADESPQHRVTLTQGFLMSATLVTQRQWRAVMGTDSLASNFHGDELPVDSVSWEAAREFCKRLSEKEGREYRLPTEAEWEYAARAGTTTPFWQGETVNTDQANFDGGKPYRKADARGAYRQRTTPVTYFRPNPWGLCDMGGNLWQWCEDRFGDYPHGSVTDPAGASSGERRVARGGSWFDHARGCRTANRSGFAPDTADDLVGFRVVLAGDAGTS
jgi:formylglycine-generating enzyme required for sulfatase activity